MLALLLLRFEKLSRPFTRLALVLLGGVLPVATLPPLPVLSYLLSTLAACELSFFLAMLAKGQPS